MIGCLEIAPIFKPEFLRDLLAVLGKPHIIKFSVSGNGISKEAIKIGESEGVELEDRYVGGAPVYLEGKASVEKILEIYRRQYEYFMLTVFEAKKRFDEVEPPEISIKEIEWYKWKDEQSRGYSIKFDRYNLKVDIDPSEEKIITEIIKSAKKHNVKVNISLRQK